MKVLIVGYGQVGRVLADLLSKEEKVEQVICGDLSIKNEETLGKISLKRLDLSDKESLSGLIKQTAPQIVVNTTLPRFNLAIMDSCLANKVHYIDSASYWGVDNNPSIISQSYYKIDQLEYNEAFKQNNIVGLINAGVSPGLTNLLATASTRSLDEIDYIKIRLIEETKADKAVFSWCKEWLIDEINSKPLVYSGNKFELVDNETEEVYDFPAPFGKKKVMTIAQDEVCTIPLYLKVKNVDIKAYDDQAELIREELKSTRDKKDDTTSAPTDIRTFEEAQFGFVLEVSGKENNQSKIIKKFVTFPKQKDLNTMKINANFITYPTALMMKNFIMSIPYMKNFGVYPPEAIEPDVMTYITNEVKESGINILRSEISF